MMIAQYACPKINDYDNLSNMRINLEKINTSLFHLVDRVELCF